MSATVDDLISSFGSGMSVGQEAIDLAALQAQLTLSFFGQPSLGSNAGWEIPRHCTTPTRTPSSSFSCGSSSPMMEVSHRQRRDTHADTNVSRSGMNEDMDEERAVEEFLISSSPSPMQTTSSQFSFVSQQPTSTRNCSSSRRRPSRARTAVFPAPVSPSASYSDSCFTSTDPFYIAQVQAAQALAAQPRSFFQSPSPFSAQQMQFGQVATSDPFSQNQQHSGSPFEYRDSMIDTRM